jgi:hypothetical protein
VSRTAGAGAGPRRAWVGGPFEWLAAAPVSKLSPAHRLLLAPASALSCCYYCYLLPARSCQALGR